LEKEKDKEEIKRFWVKRLWKKEKGEPTARNLGIKPSPSASPGARVGEG
jgi:hypothetical protein